MDSSGVADFGLVVSCTFPDRDFATELSGLFWFAEIPDPHVPHAVFGSQNFEEEVLFPGMEGIILIKKLSKII